MKKFNLFIKKMDSYPLWFIGIILEIIVFVPYFIMGEKSVFVWHDQLDENILHYIFTAKHLGEGLNIFPEMMNGLSSNSFQPNAYLFVPLYKLLDSFYAFVISYAIVFALAFYGTYFCIKNLTTSNLIATICAGCFSMLPFYPVYGGAVAGIPLCIYAIDCLHQKKKIIFSNISLLLFTLTSHLVLSGYAVLGLWMVYLLYHLIKKSCNRFEILGFFGMIFTYIVINYKLFKETILGSAFGPSHRNEFINTSRPFFSSALDVFMNGSMHADSFHKHFIILILVSLIWFSIKYKKISNFKKNLLQSGLIIFGIIVLICLLFGFWNCTFIVELRNTSVGILRNFQLDRFYWLLPALWYILLGICLGIWFYDSSKPLLQIILVTILLIPTFLEIKNNSYLYMSINQLNNGSGITGYITWDSYYSEDIMNEIEDTIGKDMSTYRIAHIGMTPAPALMHGFYTVDGYTTNYPLSYKHQFRKVISSELTNCPVAQDYFDNWGSRCYLFNSQSGISFMNGKSSKIKYNSLKYNWYELKNIGCDYIFSCGEIEDASEIGLELIGNFTSDTSYWEIWVYKLGGNN